MKSTRKRSPKGTDKRPRGRPVEIAGKRLNVYLDRESLAIAAKLGDGNVSAGIRRALRQVKLD